MQIVKTMKKDQRIAQTKYEQAETTIWMKLLIHSVPRELSDHWDWDGGPHTPMSVAYPGQNFGREDGEMICCRSYLSYQGLPVHWWSVQNLYDHLHSAEMRTQRTVYQLAGTCHCQCFPVLIYVYSLHVNHRSFHDVFPRHVRDYRMIQGCYSGYSHYTEYLGLQDQEISSQIVVEKSRPKQLQEHWDMELDHRIVELDHWNLRLGRWNVKLEHWNVKLEHWNVRLDHWSSKSYYWNVIMTTLLMWNLIY